MCEGIISARPAPRKSRRRSRPAWDAETPELPTCPADNTPLLWAPEITRLDCPACGWTLTLAPDDAAALADALAGLTPDLPLDIYVRLLAGLSFNRAEATA